VAEVYADDLAGASTKSAKGAGGLSAALPPTLKLPPGSKLQQLASSLVEKTKGGQVTGTLNSRMLSIALILKKKKTYCCSC